MKKEMPKKVLVIGSGALKIGEAGEFDYSGSQALKALKEEGIETVLHNPNIATIQTSKGMADKIYFLPVTPYFVEQVIKKERPDGVLCAFGGQTALNCSVALEKNGVFKKYGVKVLGTPIKSIIATEDRDIFIQELKKINAKFPRSKAVLNTEEALIEAEKIGYPIMVRIAYALGGLGSGMATNKKDLKILCDKAFSYANQILVEEYLFGWKEIEYEVVRDKDDNCITVCNMENFDPMGIHTGESIVVAPSQTLTNNEYHMLREVAIRVIRQIGVVGECNIQYAFNPESMDYRIIEVNARLSRSSALASKATGYPLAFVAAKLALGYTLPEIKNSITKITTACFEPSLDYVVVKIPRWDLKKFVKVSNKIGSSMMSVGEVMAVGRKFEEALQKALRMLEIGVSGIVDNDNMKFADLDEELMHPSDERIFAIAEAISKGYSIDKIHELTRIDKWFLHKIKNICATNDDLKKYDIKSIERYLLHKAKTRGFSDNQIAKSLKCEAKDVKEKRTKEKIFSCIKQIDTLGAEYPSNTNYLYLTYNGEEDDVEIKNDLPAGRQGKKIIVLGSGAYRIGSSVEFDWCCVNTVKTLRRKGYKTIMINYNPETVSTDYDQCDKLYFDELSLETIMDIYDKEKPEGIIVSMGGQTPNNLALKLHKAGAKILGTTPENIDNAENRHKFSKLLDANNIDQPAWRELTNIEKAKNFASLVHYPVLIRPSYVLSGAAMSVAKTDKELTDYLNKAVKVSSKYPVVISKFIENAKEIEIDAVAQNGKIIALAISEHIENAGVHGGDATIVLPSQNLRLATIKKIKKIAGKIAKHLHITGPFNMQFIAKDNDIKVIECNLRASRSFPFVSKVTKVNFIDIATRAILGEKIVVNKSIDDIDYVGVKYPQFSFTRLKGADPVTSVEMASTGEVGCLGGTLNQAFLLAAISTGITFPKKNILLSIGGNKSKYKLLESIEKLAELGYNLIATNETSKFLTENGVKNTMVYKVHNPHKKNNILNLMQAKKIDFVILIPRNKKKEDETDGYKIRRKAVDFAIPLITDVNIAKLFIDSISKLNLKDLEIKAWEEYK